MSASNIRKSISKRPPYCSAVIAAAGSSLRCKGGNKLLREIGGKPLLVYTMEAFENCKSIKEIVVVTKLGLLTWVAEMVQKYGLRKVTNIIVGGENRTESVYNGVFAVSEKAKLIAIHDGARPCVTTDVIERTLLAAAEFHAAAPGVSVVSTIKKAEKSALRNGGDVISETIDRNNLYEIQTPQIFRAEIIMAGLTNAIDKSIALTDDCMAAEMLRVPVHIVEGSRDNIKVTDSDDLRIAGLLLTDSQRHKQTKKGRRS